MQAYEILTMRQTGDEVSYRFDLYRKAAGFEAPGTSTFKLTALEGRMAIFDHEAGKGRITIEITAQGRLRGAWSDPAQPEIEPVVGYDAAPMK